MTTYTVTEFPYFQSTRRYYFNDLNVGDAYVYDKELRTKVDKAASIHCKRHKGVILRVFLGMHNGEEKLICQRLR